MEKKLLSIEELEAQTALELPDREMMALVTIVLITGDIVTIDVKNVQVGFNICAALVAAVAVIDCDVDQNQ